MTTQAPPSSREIGPLALRAWMILMLATCLLPACLGAGYVWQQGRKLVPVRLAEASNEARQRRIHESYLRMLVQVTRRLAPLQHRDTTPSRSEVADLLAQLPAVASLDWFNAERTTHVIASRAGGLPVGVPMLLQPLPVRGQQLSPGVAVTYDLAGLRKALLASLPVEDEAICGFVDPQGQILAKVPLELSFGDLPALVVGRNENLLRQRGPLSWDRLRICWLPEIRVALLVQRPVLTTRASQQVVLVLGIWFAGSLVLSGLLAAWLVRPVGRLQARMVAITHATLPHLDWSELDPSDELAMMEASFATVTRCLVPPAVPPGGHGAQEPCPRARASEAGGETSPAEHGDEIGRAAAKSTMVPEPVAPSAG